MCVDIQIEGEKGDSGGYETAKKNRGKIARQTDRGRFYMYICI